VSRAKTRWSLFSCEAIPAHFGPRWSQTRIDTAGRTVILSRLAVPIQFWLRTGIRAMKLFSRQFA